MALYDVVACFIKDCHIALSVDQLLPYLIFPDTEGHVGNLHCIDLHRLVFVVSLKFKRIQSEIVKMA